MPQRGCMLVSAVVGTWSPTPRLDFGVELEREVPLKLMRMVMCRRCCALPENLVAVQTSLKC